MPDDAEKRFSRSKLEGANGGEGRIGATGDEGDRII
jgi:hypothetical protein